MKLSLNMYVKVDHPHARNEQWFIIRYQIIFNLTKSIHVFNHKTLAYSKNFNFNWQKQFLYTCKQEFTFTRYRKYLTWNDINFRNFRSNSCIYFFEIWRNHSSTKVIIKGKNAAFLPLRSVPSAPKTQPSSVVNSSLNAILNIHNVLNFLVIYNCYLRFWVRTNVKSSTSMFIAEIL